MRARPTCVLLAALAVAASAAGGTTSLRGERSTARGGALDAAEVRAVVAAMDEGCQSDELTALRDEVGDQLELPASLAKLVGDGGDSRAIGEVEEEAAGAAAEAQVGEGEGESRREDRDGGPESFLEVGAGTVAELKPLGNAVIMAKYLGKGAYGSVFAAEVDVAELTGLMVHMQRKWERIMMKKAPFAALQLPASLEGRDAVPMAVKHLGTHTGHLQQCKVQKNALKECLVARRVRAAAVLEGSSDVHMPSCYGTLAVPADQDAIAADFYLLQELGAGSSAMQLAGGDHSLPLRQQVAIAAGLLSAVDELQASGAVHMDVKPGETARRARGALQRADSRRQRTCWCTLTGTRTA